jgi:sporulation protein YlmC with PRC-barrel domain
MTTTMNRTQYRKSLSAGSIIGDPVVNDQGQDLGTIKEIMIDVERGQVSYAVLSFGGFLGMGDKLFAIPWQAFSVDEANQRMVLNVDRERLERAEGFDPNNWPDTADEAWGRRIHKHYGYEPYWERRY